MNDRFFTFVRHQCFRSRTALVCVMTVCSLRAAMAGESVKPDDTSPAADVIKSAVEKSLPLLVKGA